MSFKWGLMSDIEKNNRIFDRYFNMRLAMVKNKIFLQCLACFLGVTAFAQNPGLIYNDGFFVATDNAIVFASDIQNEDFMILRTGATVRATNDITNNDTIVSDAATVLIDNDYIGNGLFSSTNSSAVSLTGDWNNTNGTLAQDVSSIFSLIGGNQSIICNPSTTEEDLFGNLTMNGIGNKVATNNLIATYMTFNDGILTTGTNSDSIFVVPATALAHGSATSHVQGKLFYAAPIYTGDVLLPLGRNIAGTNTYRPVVLPNITTTDTVLFQAELLAGLPAPTTSSKITSMFTDYYWQVLDFNRDKHTTVKARLFVDTGADALPAVIANLVPTHSLTNVAGSLHTSLGQFANATGPGTLSYIESVLPYGKNYLAIGEQCGTAKLAVKLDMEGITGTHTQFQDYLDTIYVQGGSVSGFSSSELMEPGFGIDPTTIDLVTMYIRDAVTPATVVDSINGWLLETTPGTYQLYDFETGSTDYVEFCPSGSGVTLGQDYYVEARHRNHLPLITNNTSLWRAQAIIPTALTEVDFTQASTLSSLGGYVSGASAKMIGGNASNTSVTMNKIDATDLFYTTWRMNALPTNGFKPEDANSDGNVNVMDYNIVRPNSRTIKRAVLPY